MFRFDAYLLISSKYSYIVDNKESARIVNTPFTVKEWSLELQLDFLPNLDLTLHVVLLVSTWLLKTIQDNFFAVEKGVM